MWCMCCLPHARATETGGQACGALSQPGHGLTAGVPLGSLATRRRLLDEWAGVDKRPIEVPVEYCPRLPSAYCPVPVELYGWRSTGGGCVLGSWLVPDGCLLPPPYRVLLPLLGRWERQSEKLAVGGEAHDAISGACAISNPAHNQRWSFPSCT